MQSLMYISIIRIHSTIIIYCTEMHPKIHNKLLIIIHLIKKLRSKYNHFTHSGNICTILQSLPPKGTHMVYNIGNEYIVPKHNHLNTHLHHWHNIFNKYWNRSHINTTTATVKKTHKTCHRDPYNNCCNIPHNNHTHYHIQHISHHLIHYITSIQADLCKITFLIVIIKHTFSITLCWRSIIP